MVSINGRILQILGQTVAIAYFFSASPYKFDTLSKSLYIPTESNKNALSWKYLPYVVMVYTIFLVIRLVQAGFDVTETESTGFTFILQLAYTIVFLVVSLLLTLIIHSGKEIRNLFNEMIRIITDLQGDTQYSDSKVLWIL